MLKKFDSISRILILGLVAANGIGKRSRFCSEEAAELTDDFELRGRIAVQKSILEAIREGVWDYEPDELPNTNYNATSALPGSAEKLAILASRAELGLPLWHVADRRDYEDGADPTQLDELLSRRVELVGSASPRS